MAQQTARSTLVDSFYSHFSEDLWLDGVDLYQAGQVRNVKTFDQLITGSVAEVDGSTFEVRLKLHPSLRCIQWVECTCHRNRTSGQYCEHIAAMVIHMDRETPAMLRTLDLKMPLKPPAARVRRPPAALATTKQGGAKEDLGGSKTSAAQTILRHLEGAIQGVSLVGRGPSLRVRIEIKEGQLTHYDLDLDAAAKFVLAHPGLKAMQEQVARLQVSEHGAELGTRLYLKGQEHIVAERVVALKSGAYPQRAKGDELPTHGVEAEGVHLSATQRDGRTDMMLFFPMKQAQRHVGQEYFFVPGVGYFPLRLADVQPQWYEMPLTKSFKDDAAAELIQSGFQEYLAAGPIWIDGDLNHAKIIDTPTISQIDVRGTDHGWFILDPRYGSGQSNVSMVDLMHHVRRKRRKYLRTESSWIKIPELVTDMDWQVDESGKFLKVDNLGLMRLRAAVGDFDQFVGSRRVLAELRNSTEFHHDYPTPSIASSHLQLRSYQETGLRWLWWLYNNHLHGILADEMGLGKTHQAMALMTAIQEASKHQSTRPLFLIVAPTTVLDHWYDKLTQFAPNLNPLKYHGQKRARSLAEMGKSHQAIVTSYGVLLRDAEQLAAVHWEAIILDEAHLVKNNATATYRAACKLRGRIRLCLTGTPLENHLGELKNLFDFLLPGYLGSDDFFRSQFIQPITTRNDSATEISLQRMIHPFKMRRTKDLVLEDLPAKIIDLRSCSLSDEQVKLYRQVMDMRATPLIRQLQDESSPMPYLHVFATLTLLKQICDHPALVVDGADYRDHESGKFELLKELLDEALGSGHKVVVYSHYLNMIRIIHEYLDSQNIGHAVLTGQSRNRGEIIARFQSDETCRVFCGSLLAGGIGIDLTAASVVVHYDRWWNASKENQATDRVHRIGQHKNVQVLKLITRGTLEEKIDQMIRQKQALFERFLDRDEELFKSLSRQDLIDLLSP